MCIRVDEGIIPRLPCLKWVLFNFVFGYNKLTTCIREQSLIRISFYIWIKKIPIFSNL